MNLYLDTSAIIKLYVVEFDSASLRARVLEADSVFVADIAYPEARAALAAMRRGGRLSSRLHEQAKAEFDAEWAAYAKVAVTRRLCLEAGDLAERFALRGFDAVHLACFAEVAAAASPPVEFLSFDARLSRAARLWRARR
jgi:uncharacterized protein